VPAAAACFRHPAHDGGQYDFFIFLFSVYLLFSACSGSMHEASCGSMTPPIIYYLFSVCNGSKRQASCGSCQYYYLFIIIYSFII
jgi:hypothetical protein